MITIGLSITVSPDLVHANPYMIKGLTSLGVNGVNLYDPYTI